MDANIVRDEKWGYLRIDPLPTKDELDTYYNKEFYNKKSINSNACALDKQIEDKSFFEIKRERVYEYCINYFKADKKLSLLDIGCGYAQTMLYFKDKGFKVSGIDVSNDSIEYAKSIGLDAYVVNIEEISDWKEEKFDIITLFHVLEHLMKPAEALENIRANFLKPGGLLIIDVPNDFNAFQLAANESYQLDDWWVAPPVHINYFSKDSLAYVLSQCGYKMQNIYSDFPMEIFLLMGDNYVDDPKMGNICHKKRKLFEENLIRYGRKDALLHFYSMLASVGLGRSLLSFSTY